MAEDQEWCLECGAARTVIARPPDWRIPVAVIAVILALVAGGFIYAITQLSSNAGKVTVVNPARATAPASAQTLASWQPGLDGWTVVLASASTQTAADSQAKSLASRFPGIGVLSTSQHPEMYDQGEWDVFVGRYPSYALAQAAAARENHAGQPAARPALVQRPGS